MAKRRWTPPVVDYTQLPHRDNCVRPPLSPRYPEPPAEFFDALSPEKQSWWRVNACCIQDTADDLVIAYVYFLYTYLWGPEAMFFENKRDTPAFHLQMVHDIAAFKLNCFVAPRGSCKSTVLLVMMMLLALTRRGYRIGPTYSTQKKCREHLGRIKDQFDNNVYIINDFGKVKSTRGEAVWSSDSMTLRRPFRSKIAGMWAQGNLRGSRLDWLPIDDAEKDPDTEEIVPEYVAKLARLITKQCMPMIEIAPADIENNDEVARRGAGITMVGTIIQENMLLARIADAEPGSTWDFWNRWRWSQTDNVGGYLWKARWNEDSASIMREVMGAEIYDEEMGGVTTRSGASDFAIDTTYHTYRVLNEDDYWFNNPTASGATVVWETRPKGDVLEQPLVSMNAADWLGGMDRVLLIDVNDFTKSINDHTSDYACFHMMGNDGDFVVWSLDMLMDRFTRENAVKRIVELCLKWKPRRIVCEDFGIYAKLGQELYIAASKMLAKSIGWVPSLVIADVPDRKMSKGERIDRVAWRFQQDKFRFPVQRKNSWPYSAFWHQVNNFTPDLRKLKYDDAVDTLGLIPEAFAGPGSRPMLSRATPYHGLSVVKLLEAGRMQTEDGQAFIDALPEFSHLSPTALVKLDEWKAKGEARRKAKGIGPRRIVVGV